MSFRSTVEGKVFVFARFVTCSRVESERIMGCISARLIDGKHWFVAIYLGPGFTGTVHPNNAESRLTEAVKTTAGASMGERRYLDHVHWGDDVDDNYESLLEITAANVAALLKSEFTWDAVALEAARSYVIPPEALDCIRALQRSVRPDVA